MPLIIKTEKQDAEKKPHLALTHNELQNGSANKRNVSLLMKSDVEITEDLAKLIHKVTGVEVEVTKASYETLRKELNAAVNESFNNGNEYYWSYVEDFDDENVVFASDDGMFYTTYSVEGNKVTLGKEAVSVNRVISYQKDGKLVLDNTMEGLDSGVHGLIVKSFDKLKTNDKVIEFFKSKQEERGKQMEKEVQKAVDEATEVLKSQVESLTKELEKAKEQVEKFEEQFKQSFEKSRKEVIATVVTESEVEDLFKATEKLDEDAFQVVLKSIKDKVEKVEESDLFQKSSTQSDVSKGDAVPLHIQMLKKTFNIEE